MPHRRRVRPSWSVPLVAAVACSTAAVAGDQYTVTMPESVRQTPVSGRLLLHFIDVDQRRLRRSDPIDAPFYSAPQPVAGVDVTDLKPGGSVTIDGAALAFPASIDHLDGTFRVQVLLDQDDTERSRLDGPGNLYSDVVEVTLASDRDDVFMLNLTNVVKPRRLPPETDFLRWVEVRSDLLSEFYGRDVFHRAGVALPQGYHDPANADRQWPTVYVIPGYGGRHTMARRLGLLQQMGKPESLPQVVMIVLDPESPLGHHGFADSQNNGQRGTALVNEFVPHLESQFRLLPKSRARIVTGHSSGGWSSLWLVTQYPGTFGACWSSAPDPVDFRAFQTVDIYTGGTMYEKRDGSVAPSYRVPGEGGEPEVRMTIREEATVEYVLSPDGRSGEQWDAWEAMFSPRDAETGCPTRLFNRETGRVDPSILKHWQPYDISKQVNENWPMYSSIIEDRVRLACGDQDSYYLNGAVTLFKQIIASRSHVKSTGYVWLVPRGTHNISRDTTPRWQREQIKYLRDLGWQE